MWGLHCADLPTPQVSRAWSQPAALLRTPSLVLEVPACCLICLDWVQLWPCFLPALGQPTPGRAVCESVLVLCLNLMLKFDSQDEAWHSSACTKEI